MLDKEKKIIRTFFVILLFWYMSDIMVTFMTSFGIDVSSLADNTRVILSLVASTILLIVFIFFYFKDLRKEWVTFKSNISKNLTVGFKYWIIGIVMMVISNLIINFVFKTGGANNQKAVEAMIKVNPWLMFIEAGVLAPITEEIAFRKSIRDIIKNKWIFACISFLLFGFAHVASMLTNISDLLYIIPYGALGFVFALAYDETNTVYTSIAIHMFHNIAVVLLIL